jgi:hypothetical protein
VIARVQVVNPKSSSSHYHRNHIDGRSDSAPRHTGRRDATTVEGSAASYMHARSDERGLMRHVSPKMLRSEPLIL